jgi:hypothetical protein
VALVAPLLTALPASSAQAAPAKVVAGTPYPGSGIATTATARNGRTHLVLTRAGLTKYDVGPKRVVRRGTVKVKHVDTRSVDLLIHRGGRVAYLVEEGHRDAVVQVYDTTGHRAPRLVRTLTRDLGIRQGMHRYFLDAALTPDGRQLILLAAGFVQSLRLDNPARPRKAARTYLIADSKAFAITPDSRHLLLGYEEAGTVLIQPNDLRRDGSVSGGSGVNVIVPGWEDRQDRTWIDKLVVSPNGSSVYAEFASFADASGDSGRVSTAIARIRVSDLVLQASAVPGDGGDQLFLEELSNDGRRVFLTSGVTTDEPELLPRRALWTDATMLGERHALTGLGDVRALSVSPGGATRGNLFVAAVRGDKHVLLEVDPH